jgi:hypothetical protein
MISQGTGEMTRAAHTVSRRQFLAGMGILAAAGTLALANTKCSPAILRRLVQSRTALPPQHAVFVWQFSIDGRIEEIAPVLARHNLAVIVKTHDGTDWMSAYDDAPGAIDGPGQVETVAAIFERLGVPFHAWAVVKGADPVAEARMAAAVLDAGARSLTLDLEAEDGFWSGTSDDALRFGDELRARNEYGRVDITIDPRPWKMLAAPVGEFATFCDGIRPQLYWDILNTDDNVRAYEYMGFTPPPEGITPAFLVDTTAQLLAPFDRWLIPVAEALPDDAGVWPGFAHKAWSSQMPALNVWRYGTADPDVLAYLGANPAGQEPGA